MLDRDIRREDVQDLNGREAVAAFFTALGYDTEARLVQAPANIGISNETLGRQIVHLERIAKQEELLEVYVVELSSVTVAATRGLGAALRNRAGNYLLVLTSDYERIDFVLLEKVLPRAEQERTIGERQVGIRPRVLTVDRRNPSKVVLRVLRRFTYTEPDPIAQYDKLKSALDIADWSEEHFNNRALFSDHYLRERLPETAEWKETDPKPAFRDLRKLYEHAGSRWGAKSEEELRATLLEPALRILGFKPVALKPPNSDELRPDYSLRGDGAELVCPVLTYRWGRNLDGKDDRRDTETPDENPGAVVVSLLEQGESPFAVVTNGKHWRLYAAKAHSKATSYYEIDLEETLALDDPNESFRYYWLLFRRQAFEPIEIVVDGEKRRTTFLERLLESSTDYAKRLGSRLKDRIFEEIFAHIAKGFIEHGYSTGRPRASLTQVELDAVFQGTLTLLYRLLFVLYAESRDLLPSKDARGYHDVSLTKLKREVAVAAGTITDEIGERVRKTYSAGSTDLYEDRLAKLFRVIDKGDARCNVPTYNGGLFLTEIDPGDASPEATNARFLLEHKVPDRYLALALDLLARDDDDKTLKRVFIDYKSLGVRQLGSIYEGLLEFRLRIAPEKMAICKGKKTEEVVPYAEAVKSKRKILKEGKGKNAEDRVLPKGAVYLENDRRERKATGSYYTPDYIVRFIVENTLGSILDERFNRMRPRLREAQKTLKEKQAKAKALLHAGKKADDPEREAYLAHQGAVDEIFSVKVLDPAMGSGHFLVEAVDFVTDPSDALRIAGDFSRSQSE